MHDDDLDHHAPIGDEYLDRPERPCSCCGRPFRPTVQRRRLCLGCFRDSAKHEHWHALALGER